MANLDQSEPKRESALLRIFVKLFKVYFIASAIVTSICFLLFLKFVVGLSLLASFVCMGALIGASMLFTKYAPDHGYNDTSIFDDF